MRTVTLDLHRHHPLRRRALVLTLALAFGSATVALARDMSRTPPVRDQSSTAPRADLAAEAPYLAENHAAMRKMMNDMTAEPTGDVDRDFVAMMVPHHQGAIDMARAVLRYGRNEQLKRLAQEIIVTQQQEIAAMRLAVGEPLPPPIPSPTRASPAERK
jgi:uncharacterized protein (DUF305 family)